MEADTLNHIHCTSCRRPLGISTAAVGRIYCDEYCQSMPPVTAHESRDAVIAEAVNLGVNKGDLALEVGVSRQRVGQIATARLEVGT